MTPHGHDIPICSRASAGSRRAPAGPDAIAIEAQPKARKLGAAALFPPRAPFLPGPLTFSALPVADRAFGFRSGAPGRAGATRVGALHPLLDGDMDFLPALTYPADIDSRAWEWQYKDAEGDGREQWQSGARGSPHHRAIGARWD
jgi:hypothetical protein